MKRRDVQQLLRGLVNQIAMQIRFYPDNADVLRELAVRLIEILDEEPAAEAAKEIG